MGLAGAEIETKRDAAIASGAKVTALKKKGASKDEILAEVAVLKKLKAEVTALCEAALQLSIPTRWAWSSCGLGWKQG